MRSKGILLALAVFSLVWVQMAKADLVTNGGFETGDFTGWTTIPASSGSDFGVTSATADVHSGSYAADFGATGTLDDTITQTLATVAGQSYTFGFWLMHSETDTVNDFNALWNGTPVLSLANTGAFGYTFYSFSETATGTSTDITFAGREVPSFYYLDDVSVDPAGTAPVPEPMTLLLLGSGLVGLAGLRRKA